jgi:hypothetical protein
MSKFEWVNFDSISILKFGMPKYDDCVSSTIRKMSENDLTHKNEYYWLCDVSVLNGNESCFVQPQNDTYGYCITLEEAKEKVITSLREQVNEHVKFFCEFQKEINEE